MFILRSLHEQLYANTRLGSSPKRPVPAGIFGPNEAPWAAREQRSAAPHLTSTRSARQSPKHMTTRADAQAADATSVDDTRLCKSGYTSACSARRRAPSAAVHENRSGRSRLRLQHRVGALPEVHPVTHADPSDLRPAGRRTHSLASTIAQPPEAGLGEVVDRRGAQHSG